MGVERGVVRGVATGEEDAANRLNVVGLITPLKAAVSGLRLGYVYICKTTPPHTYHTLNKHIRII
jgi:hypothetical protein